MNRRLIIAALGFAAALAAAVALGLAGQGAATAEDAKAAASTGPLEVATFGSGCFWCTEKDFDKVEGVVETTSGYMGGHTANPTYGEVGQGRSGHAEVLQVKFDPQRVSYQQLLDYYWRHVDLLDGGGQFCDRGHQYRPVIFTHGDEQAKLAAASKAALAASGRFESEIKVEILPAKPFTAAEDYHQDYHKKNPLQYTYYRAGCGRDARLRQLWGSEATH